MDFHHLGGPWVQGAKYEFFDTTDGYQETNVKELIFTCPGTSGDTCFRQRTIVYILEGNQLIAPSGADPNYLIMKLTAKEFDRKTIDSGRFEYFRRFSGKILVDTIGGPLKVIYP